MAAVGALASADDRRTDVLVIEDEPKMAKVLDRALGSAGFHVTAVGTGQRGLAALDEGGYALVILDLLLPDVDGLAVLARARLVAPDTPVLVLSAVTDVRSKVICLDLGACDYVAKPCELAELIARVRVRIGRDGAHARHRLRRGRYVLDLQRRHMLKDGCGPIALTTREFVLLQYVMERAGETCSREELLEHVWGYTFDPGTNVVDVCVGRVRHKLGDDCVVTVRNVGYCFVDP
jgi:two-component system, OmpR family, response regulator